MYDITFYIIFERFEVRLPDEFDQYIDSMVEVEELRGE